MRKLVISVCAILLGLPSCRDSDTVRAINDDFLSLFSSAEKLRESRLTAVSVEIEGGMHRTYNGAEIESLREVLNSALLSSGSEHVQNYSSEMQPAGKMRAVAGDAEMVYTVMRAKGEPRLYSVRIPGESAFGAGKIYWFDTTNNFSRER